MKQTERVLVFLGYRDSLRRKIFEILVISPTFYVLRNDLRRGLNKPEYFQHNLLKKSDCLDFQNFEFEKFQISGTLGDQRRPLITGCCPNKL